MKWLGKLFSKKKKLKYNTDNKYELLIIDENADYLHLNLGITEERSSDLTRICIDSYRKNNNLYIALSEVISECKHTNEVVFTSMIFQKVCDRFSSNNSALDFLKSIMKNG